MTMIMMVMMTMIILKGGVNDTLMTMITRKRNEVSNLKSIYFQLT